MTWTHRFRLWLALKILPRGHSIGSILHLNAARQSLIAAARFIDRSGHLTNKYKAGRRLKDGISAAATALGASQIAGKEDETPPQAS